jgi:hypothetical protein
MSSVDVFVIPIGRQRYELYAEQPEAVDLIKETQSEGLRGRIRDRFSDLVRAAEARRRSGTPSSAPTTLFGRIQDRALGWVAERVAEHHLLWNLRGQTSAVAAHPSDMTFDEVHALIHQTLRRDFERHRKWTIIDGVLFVLTFILLGPLFLLIPGIANLPALYFGFRMVSHFLAMRGADQGLRRVHWTGRPCPPLSELRDAVLLTATDRSGRVHDIAMRLRLAHLSTFVDRVVRVA